MNQIVEFRTAQQRADDELVTKIIEAVGFDAALHLRRFAAATDPAERANLLRVAEIIEERQGFGWYLAEPGQALACAPSRAGKGPRAVLRLRPSSL